ncbi:multicopper oxidase domain-containing protein [Demequina aestuarii]|uniref:multicopper oxidase domain-containing protein n=1 Tax=Demequina aestuarii TaxID=327095 RepID=UPI000784337D|nr:multicopper oxidase domain-containing protein [Demequina aestuarii]
MRARWHLRVHVLVLAWLVAAAIAAGAHRVTPASEWLMVHLLMLGGVTAAMLIWSAHFTQALRRRPLPTGRRGEAARLAAHTGAAVAVIVGIARPVPSLVIAGAAVLGAVVVWHGVEIAMTARGALSNRLGWSTWAYVGAAAALAIGVVYGVLLSRGGASIDGAARLYVSHVSLMILGWVALTVVATLITLWPTVLAVRMPETGVRDGRVGLSVMSAGLATTVAMVAVGSRAATSMAVAVVAVGMLIAARAMVAAGRARVPVTVAAWHLACAVLWMVGATVTWAAAIALASSWDDARARLGGVLAAFVVGGAAQVLLGALSHLIPMVIGGGPHAVRRSRAAVERHAVARLVLINGGVALWVLPTPSLVRVGGSVLALASAVWTLAAIIAAVRTSYVARHEPEAQHAVVVSASALSERPRLPGKSSAVAAAVALVLTTAAGVAADPGAAGIGAAASADVDPTGRTVEVEVEASQMRFTPGDVVVDAGDRLVIHVTNTDETAHDLVLDSGDRTETIPPGERALLDVGIVGRDISGWCSLAGHRQMGMVLEIDVEGAPPAHESAAAEDRAADDAAGAAARIDLQATSTVAPHPATLEPAPEGTVHRVTLEVEDAVTEVAPGVTQRLWTFGGSAPAPTLRGSVGDTFEITLVNNGDMGHSIDFHASAIAPDAVMRTIEPGESLTYTFVAERAGAWMYHCSTAPMSLHIANGMAGAVIIDPPGLAPVDREYVVVQSELYLGEQGGIADAAKIADEDPDLVVFNGHATQYRDQPLTAAPGERVRVWVVDAGPSRASSFHVVGTQFDTVFSEGAYALGGPGDSDGVGGAQSLALQPGQGGFVELTFPEPGHYPFVSHIMVDAERGAAGVFDVHDDHP